MNSFKLNLILKMRCIFILIIISPLIVYSQSNINRISSEKYIPYTDAIQRLITSTKFKELKLDTLYLMEIEKEDTGKISFKINDVPVKFSYWNEKEKLLANKDSLTVFTIMPLHFKKGERYMTFLRYPLNKEKSEMQMNNFCMFFYKYNSNRKVYEFKNTDCN